MIAGAFWCIGGLLFTGFTYLIAASRPGGGTYFLAWGAIAFGAVQFFRGWTGKDDQPNTEDLGYQELEYATHLETEGRIPEALSVYQSVTEKYPDSDAGRDAEKSIASLQARRG